MSAARIPPEPRARPEPAEPALRPPQRIGKEEAAAIQELLSTLNLDLKQPLEKVSAGGLPGAGRRRLR